MPRASRQRTILRVAVELYLETGRPVSSTAIAERSATGAWSPATVRAEMAALEEQGLLEQPHTSAGRLPTEAGLRVYLDHCLSPKLHPWDRTHLDAALDGDVVTLAARLGQRLAGITSEMTMVAVPRLLLARFREVGFARCKEGVFLAYFISPGGLVQQKLVQVDFDLTADELVRIQNFLNERLLGRTLEEVRTLIGRELEEDAARHDRLRRSALELGLRALPEPELEIVVEGARHLAGKREFAAAEKLEQLLAAIEQKQVLLSLLDRLLSGSGEVHVMLGSEHHVSALPEVTCVGAALVGPVGAGGGAIGVMGPVRMDYGRLVPLVKYAADLFGRHWGPL